MTLSTPSPAHQATSIANSATLSWADSVSSDSYKVYFGTNTTEVTAKSVNVYRGDVTSAAYDPRMDLSYGTKYYWLITAVKAGSADVDSAVWEFTIVAEAAALPDAKKYSKKVWSIANNSFWYDNDDSPPKQVVLSGLTLDTSKAVTAFELDQKVYIANDTILKVVDFVNTKLTVSGLTTAPTRGSTVTQATSAATMIVDFVTGEGAGTNYIYGRTTSGTFVTTAGYTLSGGSMTGSLVPSAVAEASTTPHHYTWTTYANDTTTYGSMPTRATIGDRWRGRACLTGNSYDPHQWYQSRSLNPYDMIYGEDDEQSAVAGTDAKAGKVGDIVTASIPYSEDYKIYGSLGDLWLLRGDPAAGGTLDMLVEGIGIISQQAWCFDDAGNLYILDLKGMYKITRGLASIEPMTSDKIPNFIKDLAINPDTQRICLSFDPDKQCIVISVTTIETGANANYVYDMQSEGFFPCNDYPAQDAIMCSHYYDADDPEQRRLLFGCYDGHIRIRDNTAKSDDIGSMLAPATAAIDSYVLLGPVMIGLNHNFKGRMNSLTVVTAGGKAGGTVPDSDDVDYAVYVADEAETVMEKADADTPIFSGTIPAPGRAKRVRRKASGVFIAVRLGNDTADETWGMERALIEVSPAGRAK